MRDRDDDDPRLHNIDDRIGERAKEHAPHAFGQATMNPWRAGQWLFVDSSERRLRFEQKALSQPVDALGVPSGCLGHFYRRGEENLNHDETTIERVPGPEPLTP